jgi:hypothetical protein
MRCDAYVVKTGERQALEENTQGHRLRALNQIRNHNLNTGTCNMNTTSSNAIAPINLFKRLASVWDILLMVAVLVVFSVWFGSSLSSFVTNIRPAHGSTACSVMVIGQ